MGPPTTTPASASPSTHGPAEVIQTILKGRKHYRVSDEKPVMFWPPHLEAALMEGLDEYRPAESKSPRGLTRFPNRDKFISEYIHKKTGETRTAKQVGSRIQQLRDTAAGKTIMKAISDKHYEMMHPTPSPPSPSSPPPFPPPTPPASELLGTGMARMLGIFAADDMRFATVPMHVYISVPPSPPSPDLSSQDALRSSSQYTPTDANVLSDGGAYQRGEPHGLYTVNPTMMCGSATATPLWSTCRVFFDDQIVHEDQPMAMILEEDGTSDGVFQHFATLSPGYWGALCAVPGLALYTIVQEISQRADKTHRMVTVMQVMYHFTAATADVDFCGEAF